LNERPFRAQIADASDSGDSPILAPDLTFVLNSLYIPTFLLGADKSRLNGLPEYLGCTVAKLLAFNMPMRKRMHHHFGLVLTFQESLMFYGLFTFNPGPPFSVCTLGNPEIMSKEPRSLPVCH
jgi:hypothetical protein